MSRLLFCVAVILGGMLLAVVLAIATYLVTMPVNAEQSRVDAAIVFIVDVSGSMNGSEVAAARQAHVRALSSPEVLGAVAEGQYRRIAVAYVEFGDRAVVAIDWAIIDGHGAAQAFGERIAALPGGGYLGGSFTAVGKALLAADELLGRAPQAERLVVDIIGDGTNSVPPTPDVGRAAILSRGAAINAMPLLMDSPDHGLVGWYTEQVAGGPGHFVMPVAGIDKMPMALRSKIVLELF